MANNTRPFTLPDGRTLNFPADATDAEVIEFLNTQDPRSTDPAPVLARDPALIPVEDPSFGQAAAEFGNLAAKEVLTSPGEISAGIGGGLLGAQIGLASPLPGGALIGGFAGSIIGSMLGKGADQLVFEDKQLRSLPENARDSLVEEVVGRGITTLGSKFLGPLSKPILNPLIDVSKKFGRRLPSNIDDLFLREAQIDPVALSQRTVKDAQQDILGGRFLTVFEETGGNAGRSLQAELADTVSRAGNITETGSAFLNNRKFITTKLKTALSPKTPINVGDREIGQGLASAFQLIRQPFRDRLNAIDPVLAEARRKVVVDIGDLGPKLARVGIDAEQTLGKDGARKLKKVINKFIKSREKGKVFKDKAKLSDLTAFEKDIQQIMGEFSAKSNKQTEMAGFLNGNVRPLFEELRGSFAEQADKRPSLRKVLNLEDERRSLSRIKDELETSEISEALKLGSKNVERLDPRKMLAAAFKSPQTWRETKEILEAADAPELIVALENRYRARILRKINDPGTGELSFSKINNILDPEKAGFDEDTIRAIAGPKFLQDLRDSRLVTLAMSQSSDLLLSKPALSPLQKIFENLRRMVFHPMAGRLGFVQGIMSPIRRSLGLGDVTDGNIFKVMTGENGQLLVEKMLNSPLADPITYTVYVQLVREINKVRSAANESKIVPQDKETYLNAISNAGTAIMDAFPTEEQ